MTTNKTTEKIIDEFIRDVCSVTPKSKSEVKRRLNEILSTHYAPNQKIEEEVKKANKALKLLKNDFKTPIHERIMIDGYNQRVMEEWKIFDDLTKALLNK